MTLKKLRDQVTLKLKELESLEQYKAPLANIQINTPLTLIQLSLHTQVDTLKYVLSLLDASDKVDPDEAPKGFKAVPSDGKSCVGCALRLKQCWDMKIAHCLRGRRKDECNVIFVKKG
jgi:hypothetical protein